MALISIQATAPLNPKANDFWIDTSTVAYAWNFCFVDGTWTVRAIDNLVQVFNAPLIDQTVYANFSAVVNRLYLLATGRKLTIQSGARFRVL